MALIPVSLAINPIFEDIKIIGFETQQTWH